MGHGSLSVNRFHVFVQCMIGSTFSKAKIYNSFFLCGSRPQKQLTHWCRQCKLLFLKKQVWPAPYTRSEISALPHHFIFPSISPDEQKCLQQRLMQNRPCWETASDSGFPTVPVATASRSSDSQVH